MLAMMSVTRTIRPMTRVAHPKPIFGCSWWNMIGYIIPPLERAQHTFSRKSTQKLLTETAAAGADTDCKGTVLLKVGGHNGNAGHEHHACTETGTEALGKDDLVVFLR